MDRHRTESHLLLEETSVFWGLGFRMHLLLDKLKTPSIKVRTPVCPYKVL